MGVIYKGYKVTIHKDDMFGDFKCISLSDKGKKRINSECIHCGNKKFICPADLVAGRCVTCKCNLKALEFSEEEISQHDKLLGSKVGRWTVVTRATEMSKPVVGHAKTYNCVCECGNTSEVLRTTLLNLSSTSCGCNRKKHGMSGTKLYSKWDGMHKRCYNPKSNEYHRYGEKGIVVCEEWHKSINFITWALENGYEEGLTLERKDPNKNYCPENCTWVTLSDQTRNHRKRVTNKSGYTGVYKDKYGFSASWQEEGKGKVKFFSIKKYGEELAELMAIEYRSHKIDMLKLQGIYYGEKHGL